MKIGETYHRDAGHWDTVVPMDGKDGVPIEIKASTTICNNLLRKSFSAYCTMLFDFAHKPSNVLSVELPMRRIDITLHLLTLWSSNKIGKMLIETTS